MAFVEVKDLSFCYAGAEKAVLHNLNFAIQEGELVLLFGASGSGKTTLLSLLKKEIAPLGDRTGEIVFHGLSDDDFSAIGYVAQSPENQMVADTVQRELAFGLENAGFDAAFLYRRIAETACYFGIEALLEKKTTDLSGGQKQLCNLCAALCLSPKLLLLDEPLAHLDPIAAENFLSVLRRIHRETGITILLCEHLTEQVLPDCDRVLCLDEGRLTFNGAPQDFCRHIFQHQPSLGGSLPAAAQIASKLPGLRDYPLTVNEGRRFLETAGEKWIVRPRTVHTPGRVLMRGKELWFAYPSAEKPAVANASLTIYAGEIHAIVGGNGAGKSTLLHLLAGVLRPLHGKVKKEKGVRSALLPQDCRLLFCGAHLLEELMELSDRFSYTEQDARALLEQFGLAGYEQRHPYDLSGGELQKAAIAKLLLASPDLLLLDEPTGGMDSCAKAEFARLLGQLAETGKGIVLITHDLTFAAEAADTVTMLSGGHTLPQQNIRAFLLENRFFTTAESRMTRLLPQPAVLAREVEPLA